jgi:hypothetical protein
MIIVDKVKKLCQIVDFAIPYDTRVNTKESENNTKTLPGNRKNMEHESYYLK